MSDLEIENEVIVGKGRELFLASKTRRTLDYLQGNLVPAPANSKAFRQNIESRRAFCKEIGARYVHLVAPDKHHVYEQAFPGEIKFSFADHIHRESGISFVYPRNYLQGLLPRRTYKRTDTHWSQFGRIAIVTLLARHFLLPEHRIVAGAKDLLACLGPNTTRITGDLGNKLNPQDFEDFETFRPSWKFTREFNQMVPGNDGVLEILLSSNPNAEGRLVIFGDSYLRDCLDLLSVFFREILFCRTRFLHKEMIQAASADYVLTENVERYFEFVAADSEAPPCLMVPFLLGREARYSPDLAMLVTYMTTSGNTRLLKSVQDRFSYEPKPVQESDREVRNQLQHAQLAHLDLADAFSQLDREQDKQGLLASLRTRGGLSSDISARLDKLDRVMVAG